LHAHDGIIVTWFTSHICISYFFRLIYHKVTIIAYSKNLYTNVALFLLFFLWL
jgi:hypothetical protein